MSADEKPAAPSPYEAEYTDIQELSEQIYAKATTLDKRDRHIISNAAKLISWVCYRSSHPDDPDMLAAIKSLKESVGKP